MPKGKRASVETIIRTLRDIEIYHAQGHTIAASTRQYGITEQTYYRWRKQYGGMQLNQVRQMKEMEKENARLGKAVCDLTLDKLIQTKRCRESIKPPASPIMCRDELLDREIFYTLRQAQVLIERWRVHYNTIWPHCSLGYRPPAPESVLPNPSRRAGT